MPHDIKPSRKQRETQHADLTTMISCDIIDNVKQGKGMKTLFDR